MKTFYYTAASSHCHDKCDYHTCQRRCLSILDTLTTIDDLKVLPSGSRFNTPSSMELRSGDIIILYAEDKKDLDTLLAQRDFFETFRIILIVGSDHLVQYGSHHTLKPRYTTTLRRDMNQLSAVLDRMKAGAYGEKMSATQTI